MRRIEGVAVSEVCRRLGQVLAVLLCLFWGAFLVEHVAWFVPGRGPAAPPPPRVWAGQALHLAMVAGLGLMAWRDKLGVAVTVWATVLFFVTIGMARFPVIALVNLLPIAAFAASWATRPAARPETS